VEDVMPKFEIEYTYTETHYDYVEVEADDEEGPGRLLLRRLTFLGAMRTSKFLTLRSLTKWL
jgi:hypothetical protein